MQTPRLHEEREWPYVLTLLPADLEDSARQSEALLRCRHIPDAKALLRMALAYAVSDLSLKDVAAWAHALGVAEITGPGLFYRLREAEGWLQRVLAQTLQSQVESAAGSSLRLAGGGCDGASWPWGEGYGMAGACADGPGHGGVPRGGVDGCAGRRRVRSLPRERPGGDSGRPGLCHRARPLGGSCGARLRGGAPESAHDPRLRRTSGSASRCAARKREIPQVGGIEFNILVPIPPEKRTKTRKWGLTAGHRLGAGAGRRGPHAGRSRSIWLLTTLSAEQASWQN